MSTFKVHRMFILSPERLIPQTSSVEPQSKGKVQIPIDMSEKKENHQPPVQLQLLRAAGDESCDCQTPSGWQSQASQHCQRNRKIDFCHVHGNMGLYSILLLQQQVFHALLDQEQHLHQKPLSIPVGSSTLLGGVKACSCQQVANSFFAGRACKSYCELLDRM